MAKINTQRYVRYLDFEPLAFERPDILVRSQKLVHVVTKDLRIEVGFTVVFNGGLGLEVGKYPVKFRNDISTQHREILIQLEGT